MQRTNTAGFTCATTRTASSPAALKAQGAALLIRTVSLEASQRRRLGLGRSLWRRQRRSLWLRQRRRRRRVRTSAVAGERFCRYRFCATDELKYRGAVGLGYRSTYKRALFVNFKILFVDFIESQTKLLWNLNR
jgi:hypothetical protein